MERIRLLNIDKERTLEEGFVSPKNILSEALFYLNLKQLSIPIRPSTAEEDKNGIDFFVFDRPVDVTCRYDQKALQKKILNQKNATILRLPSLMHPCFVKPPYDERLILNTFCKNGIAPHEYLETIVITNRSFKKILMENLIGEYPETGSLKLSGVTSTQVNNLHNLVGYLSSVL